MKAEFVGKIIVIAIHPLVVGGGLIALPRQKYHINHSILAQSYWDKV